ncbi:MAG TPA: GNAT family N-acetyltransferase [Candidatus Bathyarchaeia archaeon]|nr:GNAT family N-acetyltransferase [Candidatus Bathyarchaeia archaeon]
MHNNQIHKSNTNYEIREIREEDIDNGRLLEVLENFPLEGLSKATAKAILKEIKTNPLHKIFVAITKDDNLVIGTTTLLVEPKFIFGGGRVGHIEDVSVRKEYQRKGIGFKLVNYATEQAALMGCVKTVLDCSDESMRFYQKLGYSYQDNCMKIMHR